MRRPVIWFFLIHLALIKVALAGGTGASPILGGTPATDGEYPTVVLVDMGNALCTGTLITPEWVLTAAHCVTPSLLGLSTQAQLTAQLKIHFGTVNIEKSMGTVVTAQDSIPDPKFNVNALGQYDSGLIHLSQPVTNMKPVPLNFDAAKAPVGIAVTMVGFGATAVGGGGSVGVEYVVNQTSIACTAQEGSDKNLLCFSQVNGKGKCEGDSGGPSFAMIDGHLVEVGITSFGDQTCSAFGADTRVDAEQGFILQHIPSLMCNTDADCSSGHECFEHSCIVTPFDPSGLGATCSAGTDCDSGMCASTGTSDKCTMSCTVSDNTTCPSGFACTDAGGGQGVCLATDSGGGCCDAGGSGGPATMLVGIGLVGLVLRRRR